MQHHLDLARHPFHQLVATALPDADGSGAVFARGDYSADLRRPAGGPPCGGDGRGWVVRHAPRYRPGGQHPVMFQAEIPMQPAGMMLLVPRTRRPGRGPRGRDHFRAAPGWRPRWPGRAGSTCAVGAATPGSGARAALRLRRYSSRLTRALVASLQSRACGPARGAAAAARVALTIFHYSAPGHPGPAAERQPRAAPVTWRQPALPAARDRPVGPNPQRSPVRTWPRPRTHRSPPGIALPVRNLRSSA